MKKVITSCICSLLIFLLLFSSCAPDDNVVVDDTTNTADTVVDNSDNFDFDGLLLVNDGKPVFDIVCYEHSVLDGSPELAKKLANTLNQVCGVEFSVYSDKAQAKNDSLIVFADPSDKDVLSEMNAMENGGYKIFKEENNIILMAFDNSAMEKAVDLFCNSVAQSAQKFANGKRVGFYFSDGAETGASDKKVLVGENRIEFYSIVYAANDKAAEAAAQSLREVLLDAVGAELKITDDTTPATELEILVGVTNREESATHHKSIGAKWKFSMGYEYRLINKKISIIGADEENYCVSIGCTKFAETLIKGEVFELNNSEIAKGTVKIKYDEFAKRAEGTDVRIMTANVLSEEWGGTAPEPRADSFYENLKYYKPDVVGIQEVSLKWSNALKKLFENSDYKLIHDKFPGTKTNYSAMIYNSATTELIDSGVRQMSIGNPIGGRNMTWGVFKDKATQKTYLVINTHLDWINTASPDGNGYNTHYSREKETNELIALYKELTAKYKNLDVFLTADWNTEKDVHPFNILLEGIPVKFSQDIAAQSDWKANEIDYILATKDTKILTAHIYKLNSQSMGISDHPFGFVDAKLR